ncbi:MAG: hypothetical protein KatS3mg105_5187 [Gemmatales bacterium]|nr:MAG: hypothetical protein KatS3mg105_5187 [Gemmatales bacterium]
MRLPRPSVRGTGWYNFGTHFPWIGERTRAIDGAHVELLRGVSNPIGVKVGPDADPSEIVELLRVLNPTDQPGRITLIHRMGDQRIEQCLPPLLRAVTACQRPVLWCCDPMHGNTVTTEEGRKTRRFESVLGELEKAFEVHRQCGTWLGGVHLELTGEKVTECIGGSGGLTEADLHAAYNSFCDPRLNYEQAMEIAFAIADRIAPNR